MIEKKFFEDTYLEHFSSKVKDVIFVGDITKIYLKQTIFHPQGGGQPYDTGTIEINGEKYNVIEVKADDYGIYHAIKEKLKVEEIINSECLQCINLERRLIHANFHTAGHLICHVMEEKFPGLVSSKGHHYPESAYVELTENKEINRELICNHEINKIVNGLSLDITFNTEDNIRNIYFEGLGCYPCGGTHLKSTADLDKTLASD